MSYKITTTIISSYILLKYITGQKKGYYIPILWGFPVLGKPGNAMGFKSVTKLKTKKLSLA